MFFCASSSLLHWTSSSFIVWVWTIFWYRDTGITTTDLPLSDGLTLISPFLTLLNIFCLPLSCCGVSCFVFCSPPFSLQLFLIYFLTVSFHISILTSKVASSLVGLAGGKIILLDVFMLVHVWWPRSTLFSTALNFLVLRNIP